LRNCQLQISQSLNLEGRSFRRRQAYGGHVQRPQQIGHYPQITQIFLEIIVELKALTKVGEIEWAQVLSKRMATKEAS
jgi:hypothetical protein